MKAQAMRTVTLSGVTVRVDLTEDGHEVWVQSPQVAVRHTLVAILSFDPSDSVLSALAGAVLSVGAVA
jgi:hypothetical protein